MNRTLPAIAALVFALAGCGGDNPEPAAAPTSSSPTPAATSASPSPSPTVSKVADPEKATCRQLSQVERVGITAHLDPAYSRPVANVALQAENSKMHLAALALAAGLDSLEQGDPRGDANITIGKAWIDIADACGDLYGDGPW